MMNRGRGRIYIHNFFDMISYTHDEYSSSGGSSIILMKTLYIIQIYICIIYTPNLGLAITFPGREKEQGRFRGSTKRARGSIEGAQESIEGARGSTGGALRRSKRAKGGAARKRRFWVLGSLIWLHGVDKT